MDLFKFYLSYYEMINKSQRLLLGILILLLVDTIWITSSEVNKHIGIDGSFQKPFFVTYVRTVLFTIYFFGICACPSWKECMLRKGDYNYIVADIEEDEPRMKASNPKLSSPSYIPIKFSGKSSGTESDDSINRSVRFKKLAEVRQMSEEEATDALLARLSYTASLRLNRTSSYGGGSRLTVFQIASISFVFCLLWFLSSYLLEISSLKCRINNNALYSASAILSASMLSMIFPVKTADRPNLSKIIVILVTVVSLCIIAFYDVSSLESSVSWILSNGWHSKMSVILTMLAGFLCSLYVVLLLNVADNEEKLDIPLTLGFAGIFCLLLFWPGFFILHYFQLELFEWPNTYQWLILLINGVVGTMLSQVLWIWACFLTSSVIAAMAFGMMVPICMMLDIMLFDVKHPSLLFIGIFPISISFVSLVILTYIPSVDPILDIAYKFWSFVSQTKSFRLSEYDLEQSESLITIKDGDSHEA